MTSCNITVPVSLYQVLQNHSNCGEKMFRDILDAEQLANLKSFTKVFGWKVFRHLALNNITAPVLYCENCGSLLSQANVLNDQHLCKKCTTINPSNKVPQPQNFTCPDHQIVIPDQLFEIVKQYTGSKLIAEIAKTSFINWFVENNVTVKTARWAANNNTNIINPVYCKSCGKQLTEDQYTAGTEYCCIKCASARYEIPQPITTTILAQPVNIPKEFHEFYQQSYNKNLAKAHSRTLYKLLIDNGYKEWFIEHNVTVQTVFNEVAANHDVVSVKHCTRCGELLPLSAYENKSSECIKCNIDDTHYLDQEFAQFGLKGLPRSNKEYQLIQFVHDLIPDEVIEYNKRYPLDNKFELDIYIPKRHLAIEFNGQFYHCDAFKRITPNYHVNKTDACLQKGIRLIHVFEWEWDHNRDRVQQLIKDALNIDSKVIGARETVIRDLDSKTYEEFAEQYHFDHCVSASIRKGLFYKGQLVAAAGWRKSRFANIDQYELARYVVKDQYKIIGGLSKLCKASGLDCFISYVDRAHFTGKAYQNTPGFMEIQKTQPSYCYVRGNEVCSRYQAQKHLLQHKLKSFDPNLSEQQNMVNNGWFRVYDCGTIKYEWRREQNETH